MNMVTTNILNFLDTNGAEYINESMITQWQDDMNFKLVINRMDSEISEDHPAWVHYFENGDAGFGEWNPEPPVPMPFFYQSTIPKMVLLLGGL